MSQFFDSHQTIMKLLTSILVIIFFVLVLFLGINLSIYFSCRNQIFYELPNEFSAKKDVIVLGASVHGDSLSGALKARMEIAIDLYKRKIVENILMSGNGTDLFYSETNAMKKYAFKAGIPVNHMMIDEQGYSTSLTMERAAKIFHIRDAYVVSQDYHLLRAIWLAKKYKIRAVGISAGTTDSYLYYKTREFFACAKDFIQFKTTFVDEKTEED